MIEQFIRKQLKVRTIFEKENFFNLLLNVPIKSTTVPDESYGFLADLLIDGHV